MPHVSLFLQSSWLQDCKRHPKTWSRKPWWFKCRLPESKLQWHKFGPCVCIMWIRNREAMELSSFASVSVRFGGSFSRNVTHSKVGLSVFCFTLKMLRMQKYTRADDNDILKWKHFIIFPLKPRIGHLWNKNKAHSTLCEMGVGPDGCSKEPFD